MELKNQPKILFSICIFSSIICLSFLFVAMAFYLGGSYFDRMSNYYAFHLNFLSDLGRTVAMNGQPSKISPILFLIAMIFMAFGEISYFIGICSIFGISQKAKRLNSVSLIFGVISAFCFTGVGIASADLYSSYHNVFVFLGFGSVSVALLIQICVLLSHSRYAQIVGYLYISVFIVIAIHIFTMILFWEQFEAYKLISKVLTQKAVLLTIIAVFIISSVLSIKNTKI